MARKIKVGIDFDNTIICYDHLFIRAVQERNWNLGTDVGDSKAAIKERLIAIDGNDFRWQELQAIVYGILIKDATLFTGVIETLKYLKDCCGCDLYVVSHKTATSNYLKHITLIDKAQNWIEANDLYSFIPEDHFYFCPTREEKINVITQLKLDFFIDDLKEVLEDKRFPQINKIFFSVGGSDFSNWAKIRDSFEVINEFGLDKYDEIKHVIIAPYSDLEILKRDGNNRISSFIDHLGNKFVIKKYSMLDGAYSTLEREFEALELLSKAGLPVPKVYMKDPDRGVAIYEKIEMSELSPNQLIIKSEFAAFLTQLQQFSQISNYPKSMTARDSRQKVSDYKLHVMRRLAQLESGSKADARFQNIQTFLEETFKPLLETILCRFDENLMNYGIRAEDSLSDEEKILSPSDFGMHNAIFNKNRAFSFIDFEYFGWDDPVKLIADFLHHAGQEGISQDIRLDILIEFAKQASLPSSFFKRLNTVLDLVGLEWILIILNIANPEVLKRRTYANPHLIIEDLVAQRLQKAIERANLFHTNIESNSVFLSLKSMDSKVMEIPIWQRLIISN